MLAALTKGSPFISVILDELSPLLLLPQPRARIASSAEPSSALENPFRPCQVVPVARSPSLALLATLRILISFTGETMSAAASTSAEPAQQPRQSPEDQALGLFARSALDLFDVWPALRLAISHGWGGDGGQGKTHLAEDVVDLFYSTATSGQGGEGSASASGSTSTHEGGIPVPPMDEIEQTLLHVIGNEFDVDLEDGSEHTVARDLVNLWRECLQRVRAGEEGIAKEGPLAEKFRVAAEKARAQDGQQRFQAQRQGGDEDEGETSSEGEYETEDDEDEEMGAVEHEAPPPRERQEPIVDEDGFELVQTKKKGGRR